MFFQSFISVLLLINGNGANALGLRTEIDADGDLKNVHHSTSSMHRRHLSKSSKKGKDYKIGKKAKSSPAPTSAPTETPSAAPTVNLQPGYDLGMFTEINGYWAGVSNKILYSDFVQSKT